MASSKIKGLTIEIGGDATKLGKALEESSKKTKELSSELGSINKLLRFDPGNADLLAQKQEVLAQAVANTTKKLETLRDAEKQVQQQFERGDASAEQVRELQREIIATENKLQSYERAVQETVEAVEKLGTESGSTASELDSLKRIIAEQSSELGALKNQYTALVLEQGEGSDKARELAQDIGKLSQELTENKKRLSDAEGAADELVKGFDRAGDAAQKLDGETGNAASGFDALKKTIDTQTTALDGLKKKYASLIIEQRGSSDEARQLRKEIADLSQELGKNRKSLDDAEKAASDYADAAGDLQSKAGDCADKGLKVLTGACAAAAAALVGAAEASREYRADMGMLETAFTTMGHTAETATETYRALQGVVGESDQAVEAANHLAKLCTTQEELSTWTDICTGVYAQFGRSLPIENLTEAANETSKTGQITGGLADALNWAGVSEEEFQEKLDRCSDAQDRQALITETLNGLYADAAEVYRETNAEVIAANEANQKWMAAMADAGEAIEPVITDVKNLGATLLEDAVPLIEWAADNLPAIGTALATIGAALVAFKIKTIAATAAQVAMNVAMNANPIGLIVLAIGGLITALVALWNNCDEFREFWISLWEKIKAAASTAIDWLKGVPDRLGNAISGAVTRVKEWGSNLVETVRSAASNMLEKVVNGLKSLPKKLLDAIAGAVDKVQAWKKELVSAAQEMAVNFLEKVVNGLKALPGKLFDAISGAVDKVKGWGSSLVEKGKEAASNLWDAVVEGIQGLPANLVEIGSNLVAGLWDGITGGVQWLGEKISGFAGTVLDNLKECFDIHSPSGETAWMGEMLDAGLAEGVADHADAPVGAMREVADAMLDDALNPMLREAKILGATL